MDDSRRELTMEASNPFEGLAIADFTFPLLEHEHVLALARMLGFDAVDIGLMGNRSHLRPENIEADPRKAARALASRLAGEGLAPSDVFLIAWPDLETASTNHPDARQRARSRELFLVAVEFAAELRAPGITVLPGRIWPGESTEDGFRRASEELAWRVQRCADVSLEVGIEPHIGSIVQDPTQALRLLTLTPGLKATVDPTHFVCQGFDLAVVTPLLSHARHVHLRGGKEGRLQVPVSESAYDFEMFVGAAMDSGYSGYLTCEYVWEEWERNNECDTLSESIILRDRIRAFLRSPSGTDAGGHDEEAGG